MIDIKRRVPRFNIKFHISSNNIVGHGINISQNGLGFLTEEELIPAEDIPFETDIKGFIFSNNVYKIKGRGRLLFSTPVKRRLDLYTNGFEFIDLDQESQENLFNLLEDIRKFKKHSTSQMAEKNLGDFLYYPNTDLFYKATLFYELMSKNKNSIYEMYSYQLNTPSQAVSQYIHENNKKTKEMIMLGSNNYLGLTTHPDVINAGIEGLKKYGTGNGAGAMCGGIFAVHKKLEEELASFTGKEAVILFSSGYSANLGAISGLLRPQDAAINDQFNHTSIFDGCHLSGAKVLVFSHNNFQSLERILNRAKLNYNGIMVIVDGIYSTNGEISDLEKIIKIAKKYDCKIMVDESHSFGLIGKKGIGATEVYNAVNKVDIIMATMSKTLAGIGGFVASTKEVIEYLRFYARSYSFSTTIPPAVACSSLKALEILRKDNSIRAKLNYNINLFKTGLLKMNLNIGDPQAAIIPVYIPDMKILNSFSSKLFNRGVYHNMMTYPAVPMGGSLIRFGVTSLNGEDELNRALSIIQEVAQEEGVFDLVKQSHNEILENNQQNSPDETLELS